MGLCCGGEVKWKREVIQDHSFDYVDPKDFKSASWWLRIKYFFIFLLIIQSVLIYASDCWTAYNLAFNYVQAKKLYFQDKDQPAYRYVFLASIGISFLLLIYEVRKSWIILRSRDISFTYTNVISHRIYILGSYYNFCFFEAIGTNKHLSDFISFYVFFTLKGWKRVLFAQAPREVIKTIILVLLIKEIHGKGNGLDYIKNPSGGYDTTVIVSLGSLIITNLFFIISILQIILSGILYIPLLFKIQGNLKEYCCHKIDKRITRLLQNRAKNRNHLPEYGYKLNQMNNSLNSANPTLPKIQLQDDNRSIDSDYSNNSTTTLTGGKSNKQGLRPFSPNSIVDSSTSSRTATPTKEIYQHNSSPSNSSNSRNIVRSSPNHNPSFSNGSNTSNFRPPPSAFNNKNAKFM